MWGMIDDPECPKSGKHCDPEATQIKKSQYAIKKIVEDTWHFRNPWKIADNEILYYIASGAPVIEEIGKYILWADELGKTLKNKFIQKRLKDKHEKLFFILSHDRSSRLWKMPTKQFL